MIGFASAALAICGLNFTIYSLALSVDKKNIDLLENRVSDGQAVVVKRRAVKKIDKGDDEYHLVAQNASVLILERRKTWRGVMSGVEVSRGDIEVTSIDKSTFETKETVSLGDCTRYEWIDSSTFAYLVVDMENRSVVCKVGSTGRITRKNVTNMNVPSIMNVSSAKDEASKIVSFLKKESLKPSAPHGAFYFHESMFTKYVGENVINSSNTMFGVSRAAWTPGDDRVVIFKREKSAWKKVFERESSANSLILTKDKFAFWKDEVGGSHIEVYSSSGFKIVDMDAIAIAFD